MKGNQGLDALAAALSDVSNDESAAPTGNGTKNSDASAPEDSSKKTVPAASCPPILPKAANQSAVAQPNVSRQPFPQAMAAGAAFGANPANSAAATQMAFLQAAALQGAIPPGGTTDQASLNAMQQLAYLQYMQMAQTVALKAQMNSTSAGQSQQPQVPITFVGQNPQLSATPTNITQGVQLPKEQKTSQQTNSMQPPLPLSSQTSVSTTSSMPALPVKSSPQPMVSGPEANTASSTQSPAPFDDKRQLKRAANRRSAQLSRKRKKQFIEELKEENDELRRKEQILKSIPDLIVAFDSSGKLWFVSHSVSRFLDFSSRELEKSSFWDRLCDESVRLLKAAFMDALAARQSDMDTTPLGSGVWELRLVDKDGSHKIVTLNGVVHFTGESPECVCTIRPRDEEAPSPDQPAVTLPTHRTVSVSSGGSNDNSLSLTSSSSNMLRPRIMPQQSAISNRSDDSIIAPIKARRSMHQVSDGDSGSCPSESGSDELS